MMRLVLVVPFVLLASAASAQQGRDACARDASRFCRPYLQQGDQAVLACLKQHRGHLSRACGRTLTEHGQ